MNFYKRFIGDIQAKTGGLTLAEFGAYDRLLDHYYSTEQPVPQDEVYRICRAMSASERAAVDKVLSKFFEQTPAGYAQSKADDLIAKAQPLIAAARENGKKGGRPKKETAKEPSGFQKDNPAETQPEKASQSQSQTSPSLRSGERATSLPKDWQLPDEYRAFCVTARPDLDPDRVAAKFSDYWTAKPGKDGRKTDWLATWRNWVRDERAPKTGAVQEERRWYDSRSGVERKAQEVGIGPWNEMEEQWPTYRQRVMRAERDMAPALSLDQLAAMAQQRGAK